MSSGEQERATDPGTPLQEPPAGEPRSLLGSKQERLYSWVAVGVLALVATILATQAVSQSARIERLERLLWQQSWGAGETAQGATAGSESSSRASSRGGKRDNKPKNRPFDEEKAARERQGLLDRVKNFASQQNLPPDQRAALEILAAKHQDQVDKIRKDNEKGGRHELLQANFAQTTAQATEILGKPLADKLVSEVLRVRGERGAGRKDQ